MSGPIASDESNNYSRKITAVFLFLWLISSVSNNLMKKKIMGNGPNQLNWPSPLFISAAHLNVEAWIAGTILWLFPSYRPTNEHMFNKENWMRVVIPSCIVGTIDIALNNYSMSIIPLSLVFQIRSATPIWILMAGWLLFGKEKPTPQLFGVLLFVVVGVVMMLSGSTPDPSHSPWLTLWAKFCCLLATFFAGIRWNWVHDMIEHTDNNQIYVDFVMACVMGVFMTISSFLLEGWPSFEPQHPVGLIVTLSYVSGIMAFVMIVSSFVVMSHTSVVAFGLSGVCVELTIIYFSHRQFGEQLSIWSMLGLLVVIICVIAFNIIRSRQSNGH